MIYSVESEVFEKFPGFRRGVLVATDIDNSGSNPEVSRLLAEAVSSVPSVPTAIESERVDVWNHTYKKLGIDPFKITPSISFLLTQIRRGKPPKSINTVVDLFNLVSLRWTIPCGGDDISSLGDGDLCLGFAHGNETFAPLFKPTAIEKPLAGEIIYYTPQTRRVLCRRWTWRNSDFSKLTTETQAVAINLDMMIPPFGESDVESALTEIANLLRTFCGGILRTHVLTPSNPAFNDEQ